LVKWFRNTFAQAEFKAAAASKSAHSIFAQLDAEMPAGPTKLLVLPYFEPTGAPGFIQNVSGSITGLTMSSTRGDILKAILECETFYFIASLEMLKTLGIDTTYFVATGGGSKSDFWLQIKTDIFGVPFERCATSESSVLGDVMIAAKAIGIVSTYEEAVKVFVKPGKIFEPNPRNHAFYQEKYEYYKQLYPAVKDILPWTIKDYSTS